METDVGFVTCRCYGIDSEAKGKDCPPLFTSSPKVNPRKRAHFLRANDRTTGGSIHKENVLNGRFIQVKAAIKLPLSTYDTILPLETLSSTI